MGRARSPNYPAIGLEQAIAAATALYQREQRTPVAPEVAAKAWGYKSMSGPARSRLAALKHYGLVEETPQGVRISDLALNIIIQPTDSRERRQAIIQAAINPDLFRELSKSHAQASDDALRAYLVTKRQFTEDGAKQFIKAFRETLGLAKLHDSEYIPGREPKPILQTDDAMTLPISQEHQQITTRVAKGFSVPVSGGLIAEVNFKGAEELTPEDVDVLVNYLGLVRQALARVKRQPSEDSKAEGSS